MASRRMIAVDVVDSDNFLDMSLTAQCLYFHLSVRADDEGFISNPKRICRTIGSSEDDLKLLIAKKFVIPFESGIIVITHWNINNQIRKDRIKDTMFTKEKGGLMLDDSGKYLLKNTLSTKCPQSDNQVSTKCPPSIGKYSIGEVSIDKYSKDVLTYREVESEDRKENEEDDLFKGINF